LYDLRILCCTATLLTAVLGAAPGAQAHGPDSEELALTGVILVGATTVLPHTFMLAQLAGGGMPESREDRRFMGALCIPMVGLAIAGISLMEEHPLTVVCGLFMCLLSGVQTVGYCMLFAAGIREGPGRFALRVRDEGPRVRPMISPGGIGIQGRF